MKKTIAKHVNKITNVLISKREKQTAYDKSMNRIHYWLTLLILTICSFMITIILVPFLLVLPNSLIYIIVLVLGFLFGLIFTFIVLDLEHLEKHHHIFAGFFIPLVALINMLILVALSKKIGNVLKIAILPRDPLIISLLYIVAFILPYLFYSFYTHAKKTEKK
jgi:hypothetical protein